jgi:hypothetical protein
MQKLLYTQALSRQYPGLFVILLDQSSSMAAPIKGDPRGTTKAQKVTDYVNKIIQEMIDRAGVEEKNPGIRKKYAYLTVLGYHDTVTPLLSNIETPVGIPMLAQHPRGTAPERREIRDKSGKLLKVINETRSIWIEPSAGQRTNMILAFEHARSVADGWLRQNPEFIDKDLGYQMPRAQCFPPVVINVTDGYYTTGNPRKTAEDLCRLHTNNGNVLAFTCHFSDENQPPCVFPSDVGQLRGLDPLGYAEQMFYMSSIIPEPLRERAAREMRRPVDVGARGFIYNATFEILASFLRWGTVDASPITVTGGA